jgi:hypothetical protein
MAFVDGIENLLTASAGSFLTGVALAFDAIQDSTPSRDGERFLGLSDCVAYLAVFAARTMARSSARVLLRSGRRINCLRGRPSGTRRRSIRGAGDRWRRQRVRELWVLPNHGRKRSTLRILRDAPVG